MLKAAYWWLLVPALGLLELAGHFWASQRAPELSEWRELRPKLEAFKQADELLVIAPEWAEPLARHALGDELLPIAMLARPDARGYERAVEVSVFGERSRELASWQVVSGRKLGAFTVRELLNPAYAPILYNFVEHVQPPELSVTEGEGEATPCVWSTVSTVISGGLHGNAALPRERFACRGGGVHLVGVTIIDDQQYRPRRCIWAHPSLDGALRLTFSSVPLGKRLRGYGGLSYFLARDGLGTPVELTVRVAGRELGRYLHHDERGWNGFEMSTGDLAGTRQDVEITIESASPEQRTFCFHAESV
jgi:hypothetical protein